MRALFRYVMRGRRSGGGNGPEEGRISPVALPPAAWPAWPLRFTDPRAMEVEP